MKPESDTENIRTSLSSTAKILSNDGSKIILSVPSTPELPDILDGIEQRKSQLGITGISVSLITLEQVFLK